MTAIHRYEIPVDDQWHTINLTHDPIHVAARNRDLVEFWAPNDPYAPRYPRNFRAYGTGQLTEDGLRWHGTAITANGQLVWHLAEDIRQIVY